MWFKILSLILFSTSLALANPEVSDFDLMAYSPVKFGLKDLTCEVRIEGLAEQVKKQYVTIKVKDDVYYEVYWMYPGKLGVEVVGLPFGFDQLKQSLIGLVINRLDYLIPQDLAPKLRGYKLEKKKVNNLVMLEGEDPTNTKAVNKIAVGFDGQGILKSYKSYSPLGFQESEFEYEKKTWSKNKFVLENVNAKMIQGPQITETQTDIEYANEAGFGMPREVKIVTKQSIVAPGENEKKEERSGESKITFSKYKLNVGEAQKYFRAKE